RDAIHLVRLAVRPQTRRVAGNGEHAFDVRLHSIVKQNEGRRNDVASVRDGISRHDAEPMNPNTTKLQPKSHAKENRIRGNHEGTTTRRGTWRTAVIHLGATRWAIVISGHDTRSTSIEPLDHVPFAASRTSRPSVQDD